VQPNVFSKHKLEDLSITIPGVKRYSVRELKSALFRIIDSKNKTILSVSGFGTKLEAHPFFSKTKLVSLAYPSLSKEADALLRKESTQRVQDSSLTFIDAPTYLNVLASEAGILPSDLLLSVDKYAIDLNLYYIMSETDAHFELRQALIAKYRAYINEWTKRLSVGKAEKAKTDRLAAKVDDLESLLSGLKRAGVNQEDAVCVKIRKQLEISKAKLQPLLESSGGTPKKITCKK